MFERKKGWIEQNNPTDDHCIVSDCYCKAYLSFSLGPNHFLQLSIHSNDLRGEKKPLKPDWTICTSFALYKK